MRLGVFGTSIWLIASGLFIYWKWADVVELDPNTLGDMLAGFVSPLAFLWLIVATWMQRQELELQRKEIAAGREVQAAQQGELEKTAKENAEQTKIMGLTLQSTQEGALFHEHSLRMYYLAKYIHLSSRQESLAILRNGDIETHGLYAAPDGLDVVNSIESVDRVLATFTTWQTWLQNVILENEILDAGPYLAKNLAVRDSAVYIHTEIQRLADEKYRQNPLVAARLKGVDYDRLAEKANATVRVIFDKLA